MLSAGSVERTDLRWGVSIGMEDRELTPNSGQD